MQIQEEADICNYNPVQDPTGNIMKCMSCPKVIKLCSCSTQLSMKFILLIALSPYCLKSQE